MDDRDKGSPVDVAVSELIRRPVEIVANYACDPSHAPAWYTKISEVVWETTPPLRVGTRIAFVARFLGRELRYTYEVVEHTLETLVMRTAEGPFPMETTYRFEPTPAGGTRMTLRNRGNPTGFSRLASPFIRMAMRRAMRADLEVLKRLLERDQLEG